ncbi:MAG: DUF1549 and DUF1553 domain-containing protein [Planctomycetes bacterium]|nr:DUF1549 and DUF1553 domain-containing protein [Planctomycetota bacterium]
MRFESNLLLVTAFVVCLTTGFAGAEPSLHERIDQSIAAKTKGPFAKRTTDPEFARRVYLDFAGRIPSAAEARAFIADTDTAKRGKLIDKLLASPEYARRMQQAMTVFLTERRPAVAVADSEWNAYVQKAFAANTPWDVFIRDLIAADGKDEKHRPAVRFFADGNRNDAHQLTRDVGRLFLGINFNCSQCHDDPNIKDFKQSDYFGVYTYLRNTQVKADRGIKTTLVETVAQDKQEFQSVFTNVKATIGPRLPNGMEVDIPKFPKGKEFDMPGVPKFRPRELLATHLTAPANARFARSSVNYFWFLLIGRGLVHPLDMMHTANPPSHPEILDALSNEFVAKKFDVKHILREIALSEAYQRSSILPEGVDAQNVPPQEFRVAVPRPLSAEQLAFSAMTATGHLEEILAAPAPKEKKFTYKEYVNGKIPAPSYLPDVLDLFGATFGSPPGTPEVDFAPSMSQALFLMNDKLIMHWLDPKGAHLIADLAKQPDAASIAKELYLRALTRQPTEEEMAIVSDYLTKHLSRRNDALSELAWAVLTSGEFRFNH